MNIDYDKGLVLIAGPVRSGKSQWAEKIASLSPSVKYIATHSTSDNSTGWNNRLKKHKQRRLSSWKLIETSDIVSILEESNATDTLLIDSLGGVVAHSLSLNTGDWELLCSQIISSLKAYNGLVIIVIEEVGWSVSPSTEIGNLFRDRIGDLSQLLHNISTSSWLVLHNRAINIDEHSIKI